jgi:NAD(P)-dependent dehydrogenase (short-subunit alcohol dehydrogenase family)
MYSEALPHDVIPPLPEPTTGPANARAATSAIAPPVLIHALARAALLPAGSKILLVSSESSSIALRHPKEGGGNYAHHASKAALNMVGKLLSLDLRAAGVIISIVHPGFMRTDMTRGVGFDKFWDDGGAVTPEVAAESLLQWAAELTMDKSGEYWAPRGPSEYLSSSFAALTLDGGRG